MRSSSAASRPAGPSRSKSTSGMRQKFTSVRARVALAATNPELRPISFTSPMPCGAPVASLWALRMASVADSTAVWKPKETSTKLMSLSMVLGMATTAIFRPRLVISSPITLAACRVPSPPMVKNMPMFSRSRASTTSSTGCGPRLMPKKEPPRPCTDSTTRGVEIHQRVTVGGDEPFQPVAHPHDVFHPVQVVQLQHDGPHQVVQPRAHAPAAHDGHLELGGGQSRCAASGRPAQSSAAPRTDPSRARSRG